MGLLDIEPSRVETHPEDGAVRHHRRQRQRVDRLHAVLVGGQVRRLQRVRVSVEELERVVEAGGVCVVLLEVTVHQHRVPVVCALHVPAVRDAARESEVVLIGRRVGGADAGLPGADARALLAEGAGSHHPAELWHVMVVVQAQHQLVLVLIKVFAIGALDRKGTIDVAGDAGVEGELGDVLLGVLRRQLRVPINQLGDAPGEQRQEDEVEHRRAGHFRCVKIESQ